MFVLSLLHKRISGLLQGAALGEVASQKRRREADHEKITTRTIVNWSQEIVGHEGDVRQAFSKRSILNDLDLRQESMAFQAPGLAVPIGIIKRPQDHNGIVDDVITTLVWSEPSGVVTTGTCALAATIAGLLDGWGMEGALDLALFVGKRGQTFGAKTSVDIVSEIEAVLFAVEDASYKGLNEMLPRLGLGEDTWGIVPCAFGFAFAYRDIHRAIEAALDMLDAASSAVSQCVASIVGALCAADDLDATFQDNETGLSSSQLENVVHALADFRTSYMP